MQPSIRVDAEGVATALLQLGGALDGLEQRQQSLDKVSIGVNHGHGSGRTRDTHLQGLPAAEAGPDATLLDKRLYPSHQAPGAA